MDINERIKGGIFGLIVGDALGVPYEFNPSHSIPKWEEIEFKPPKHFSRTYSGIEPGTWSDDSAQALCLLDSLLECNEFNLKNFSEKLYKWYEEGLWAVDNNVFDCGIQTSVALKAFYSGVEVEKCGFVRPDGKGNGALMRVLPLALWHNGTNEELVLNAHKQCLITHGHTTNQVCSALYCLWVRNILNDDSIKDAYESAYSWLKNYYNKTNKLDYLFELEDINSDGEFSGSGYVVDSLRSTKHLLYTYDSYEGVIKGAVSLGNDTDTTAAIAGGIAGAYYGYNSIPKRFLKDLRDKQKVEMLMKSWLDIQFK